MAGQHAAGSGHLDRGAIGLREVMFQSITSMAPAGAVALSIAAARYLRRRRCAGAVGPACTRRLPACRELHRPTRQAPALGWQHLHLSG
jgi:hypothetical protein